VIDRGILSSIWDYSPGVFEEVTVRRVVAQGLLSKQALSLTIALWPSGSRAEILLSASEACSNFPQGRSGPPNSFKQTDQGCTLLALFGMTIALTPSKHGSIQFSLGVVSSVEDFVSVTPAADGATRWDVRILPQTYPVPLVGLLLIQVVAFRFFSRLIRRPGND
jgi:hypothetical protein